MKRIIGIVVIMAVFWAGNWYWGLSTNLDKTAGWFGAQGDVFEHSEQHGFPNRYDVTLSDVTIADIGFDAEFVQILRVVYKSDHRIIILPNRVQIWAIPDHRRNARICRDLWGPHPKDHDRGSKTRIPQRHNR